MMSPLVYRPRMLSPDRVVHTRVAPLSKNLPDIPVTTKLHIQMHEDGLHIVHEERIPHEHGGDRNHHLAYVVVPNECLAQLAFVLEEYGHIQHNPVKGGAV